MHVRTRVRVCVLSFIHWDRLTKQNLYMFHFVNGHIDMQLIILIRHGYSPLLIEIKIVHMTNVEKVKQNVKATKRTEMANKEVRRIKPAGICNMDIRNPIAISPNERPIP